MSGFNQLPKSENKMTVSTTGGLRDNKGKYRPTLVPSELIEAVAEVIWASSDQAGGKYPLHNWRKGLPHMETMDSLMRHCQKWLKGEDIDPETGLHHFKHIATNIAFLLVYIQTHPELDNRPIKPENK